MAVPCFSTATLSPHCKEKLTAVKAALPPTPKLLPKRIPEQADEKR
jgi:hypothetical protein